jgi:hypothetical protein
MALYNGGGSDAPPSRVSQDVSDIATSTVPMSTLLSPGLPGLGGLPITSSTEDSVTHASSITMNRNSRVHINNIKFKVKPGYYYSKAPIANLNFPGGENYIITTISELKNKNGYVIEKDFEIKYNSTEFDVLDEDGHNITFTNKIAKEVDRSTEVKEITGLRVNTSVLDSSGESRNISISGTPGSTFSLTIKDKNGRNILPYTNKVIKTIKTAATASSILELDNATNLEVGMVVLNDQKRNVKITSITDPVKANVDTVTESTTTNISISSFLTFSADDNIIFVKEADITEVAIPDNGVYSFIQNFPALEKFKRTLKTAASSTTSLTLDYNDNLERSMKITGTGVDGNDPIIVDDVTGVNDDGVQIRVSDAQTIADETELTFEMPDNRYDITLYPLKAILSDNIPTYSSDECDTLPTYSIYQYIDPIVQITPSSALSNVTVDGTITLTGKANKIAGTGITISMTATKSDGNLATSREPRFSDIASTVSDFSNTVNMTEKRVRNNSCRDKDIIHLNNTTDIRVGMIVIGENINTNKTITVKSITGTAVKLSEKQTINKDDLLTFNSMFRMDIDSLTATLSANGGLSTGVCTVAGTGQISTFGIDSFTSTFDFDNFLSLAE